MPGIDCRRQTADPAMGSDGIEIASPVGERLTGVGQRGEQCLVQEFIPELAVEALDEGILGRLARRDVVPCDLLLLCPPQHRHAGEFGSVVADDRRRPAASDDDDVEFADHPLPGQGGVCHEDETFGASATARTRRSKGSLLDADKGSQSNAD